MLLFCGCSQTTSTSSLKAAATDSAKQLPLYYYKTLPKGDFEPESGCMTGAVIFKDKFIHGDMEKFEELTGKSHDIYGYEMKPSYPFPMDWMLNCLKSNKLPLVTLYPQNKDLPYDISAIETAAKTLNTYSIPMLLQFYPNPSSYGDSEKYSAFFTEAREIFKKNAPNVSFVWSVSPGMSDQGAAYYPGEEYVDWIGLSYYLNSDSTKEASLLPLEPWYYEWQSQKPLIVFAAISHYSTKSTVYTEQESADSLLALYSALTQYPRIKAVVYQNENPSLGVPLKAPRENYLITENSKMLTAYKNSVRDSHFSPITFSENNFSKNNFSKNNLELLQKSPFDAISLNGRIYIPLNMVKYELEKNIIAESRFIDGNEYVSQDAFRLYNIELKDSKVLMTPLNQ